MKDVTEGPEAAVLETRRDAKTVVRACPLAQVNRAFATFFATASGLLLASEVAIVSAGVFCRYILGRPLFWSEEIARLILVWLTFFGGIVALYRGQHITVDALYRTCSPRTKLYYDAVAQFVTLAFLGVTFWRGIGVARLRWTHASPVTGISESIFIIPLLIGTAVMILATIERLFRLPRREAGWVLVALAILGGLYVLVHPFVGPILLRVNPLLFMLAGFLILLALNTPVAFALGMTSLAYLLIDGTIPLGIMVQRMVRGVDSFVILAVPLFILAGALMETGGISARLVELATALVGHIRGGLGMVVVVSEVLFSGISGSTAADTAAMGSLLIPAMNKEGYSKEEAASIVSASAAMGILVPPCIHMVVLGTIVNVSVAALFFGGFLPAFLLAASVGVLIYVKAGRYGWPTATRASFRGLGKAFLRALIPLMTPVIIFGGIYSGAVTVTESAVLAVLYALGVGLFLYREMNLRDVARIFVESASVTGLSLWLVTTATVFSWIMVYNRVPDLIAESLGSVSTGTWFFLLMTILTYLVFGGLLEGLPALLIIAPVYYPVALQLGIHPVHFGLVSIAALGIGFFMPPVGLGLFLACSIAKANMADTAKVFWPYILILTVTLFLIALFPPISLFVPSLFGYR